MLRRMQRTLCELPFTSPYPPCAKHTHRSPPHKQSYCSFVRHASLFPLQDAATQYQNAAVHVPKRTADTMPPDNIITSLKQGNALELEFIKKLRDGLDVIADGMQSECYKRGDALEELREMLDGVNLVSGDGVGLEGVAHCLVCGADENFAGRDREDAGPREF
jgi:hypothetical protein